MRFEQAFERLLGFEGGLVDDARDAGGLTKWGISQRALPGVDIATLTREDAARIYRERYWVAVQADRLPEALRYAVFDAAVHSGVSRSIRWLQQALGVAVDGQLGPLTRLAALQAPVERTRARLLGLRLEALTAMPDWSAFGRGWARRLAAQLQD